MAAALYCLMWMFDCYSCEGWSLILSGSVLYVREAALIMGGGARAKRSCTCDLLPREAWRLMAPRYRLPLTSSLFTPYESSKLEMALLAASLFSLLALIRLALHRGQSMSSRSVLTLNLDNFVSIHLFRHALWKKCLQGVFRIFSFYLKFSIHIAQLVMSNSLISLFSLSKGTSFNMFWTSSRNFYFTLALLSTGCCASYKAASSCRRLWNRSLQQRKIIANITQLVALLMMIR